MNIVNGFRLLSLAVVVAVPVSLQTTGAHAERVGFRFEGALQGGSTGTYTLFGVTVPRNSPVTGTFSYDTAVQGIDTEPSVKTFHQDIQGGYNLDINNGAIQLSASDYVLTVANDFQRSPEFVDILSVDFDSRFNPTPTPIFVNGVPWEGLTAFVKAELSWPSATFVNPDEPKLTADRPLTPGPGISAFVGSSPTPRPFSINSISAIAPLPGDFNHNGEVDNNDYSEWKSAYGETGEAFHFADGNSNGVVDAADYVVWRNAVGSNSAFEPLLSQVPEPCGLVLAVVALIAFTNHSSRTNSCHYLA